MFMTACEIGLLGFGRLLSHYFLFGEANKMGLRNNVIYMRLEKKNDIVLLLQLSGACA